MINFSKVFVALCFLLATYSTIRENHLLANGFDEKKKNIVRTPYISSFRNQLILRTYFSRKFTGLSFEDRESSKSINYLPNTSLNFGVGFTYHSFTLNLGLGLPFLNNRDEQGKTLYLDLQTNFHSRKWLINGYVQLYKGMYLQNTAEIFPMYALPFYLRPDILTKVFGISAIRSPNGHKHSIRASLVQDERQKKSAGSLLYGLEFYYVLANSDESPLIPEEISIGPLSSHASFTRTTLIKAGPSVGYVHTFVLSRKFFLMLSLTLNIGLGHHSYSQDKTSVRSHYDVYSGVFTRAAIGYNSDNWFVGVSFVNNTIGISSASDGLNNSANVGNFRFNVAKRIQPSNKLSKIISKVLFFLP